MALDGEGGVVISSAMRSLYRFVDGNDANRSRSLVRSIRSEAILSTEMSAMMTAMVPPVRLLLMRCGLDESAYFCERFWPESAT